MFTCDTFQSSDMFILRIMLFVALVSVLVQVVQCVDRNSGNQMIVYVSEFTSNYKDYGFDVFITPFIKDLRGLSKVAS